MQFPPPTMLNAPSVERESRENSTSVRTANPSRDKSRIFGHPVRTPPHMSGFRFGVDTLYIDKRRTI